MDFAPALRPKNVQPGVKHYCYRNALRLASNSANLVYIEGFAILPAFKTMPQPHAWCASKSGEVIDPTPTWADKQSQLPLAMRGVAIPVDLVHPYVECDEPTNGFLSALAYAETSADARLATAFFSSDDPGTFVAQVD